uniref:Uncharacterized protein n=1 Tax=Arundo donax TaxID=35708 RepID=A0A0A9HM11_ARUDO
MYSDLLVLKTNIHLDSSFVFTKTPLCLYSSLPSSTTTSYAALSFGPRYMMSWE